MAQRNPAKHAKKPSKMAHPLSAISKMEKDLLQTPSKLAIYLNKEMSALKQKTIKLKKMIHQLQAKVHTTQARIQETTGKKQLAQAKKTHQTTLKMQTMTHQQLQETTKLLEIVKNKQTKVAALRSHLNQFEKTWSKNPKTTKISLQKTSPILPKEIQPKSTVTKRPQSHVETLESTIDNVRLVDTTETTP